MDPDPEPSREPEEPGAGDGGPGGGGSGGAGGGLLASVHLVHVQLCGGAPWGFTLKGGLEHGGPLIVSKVEDGGKAALSQKMRSGDELVNINGTPLYGSRQEALILIKGSYRTLKMIIRRRNVPVIRPHSWHLAKLSEGRTEAATMPCPPDAFSLSWHSGCDTSDLPLSWTPLSRHCSTDKSSSLGSMESLGPPSQSYCEGSLSPIDQAMYQNKRDSAYSSFSASSNASDSALRPEEGSSAECVQQPDPRYLQTGGEGGDPAVVSRAGSHPPGHQPVSYARAGPFLASAKAAPSPPQPPVRQDSLRACNPEGPKGPLNPKGRWTSDTSLSVCGREPQGSTGQGKDSLATEQYYLLSSHSDQSPAMEKGVPNAESLLNEEAEGDHPLEDPGQHLERKSNETDLDSHHITCPSPWKKGWSRPLGHHRHSAPEHLLAAQLQALNVAHIQEGPQWTVSPLHVDQKGPRGPKPWMNQDRKGQGSPYQTGELDPCPGTEEGPQHHPHGLERPRSASVDLPPALSPKHQHQPPLSGSRDSQVASSGASALKEGVRDPGGSHPAPKKGVLAQHRSAQMRRQSDRFATNLRNEIQWRKAQLQKAKGTAAILCGEEAVQETEEPPSSPSSVDPPSWSPPPSALDPSPSPPPPPIAESMPHGSGPSIRRWGSELSVFGKEATSHSPGRGSLPAPESRWKAQGPERPPKSPVPPMSGRGRRWHWSPEYKLQPHDGNPQPAEPESPSRLSEESSGLLPFADRRRFFEESSKPLSPVHLSPRRGRFGGVPPHRREEEQNTFQLVSSEHKEQQQRRHSMDQAFGPSPSPPTYQDFRPEVPTYYKPLARHRPDWECWQPLPCSCAPREACLFCYGERCPSLHQRNLSVPPGHCAHRCHPHSWTHCPDCCCPAQHQRLEERGAPWHGRKAFQMEFPVDDWEPPAINRKTSQSMSELPQHKMGFARASPFWTCFEEAEPEWPPAFCRAISARNLSWDGERPGRVAAVPETPDYEEPRKPPLRGRAYSESHLCAELASGATERERREAPLAKVEETLLEPPCVGKKKGPPPPRPPPPNWEKYRRASHNQLLSTKAGPAPLPEDPRGSGQEAARQRSQSLPLEQLWSEAAHLQPLPCASPPREGTASSPGAPAEQSSLRYYCHSSPCQTPEWSTPDASERSGSSRPSSSLDEDAMPESVWEKGQSGPSTCKTTEPSSPVSLPSSPSPKGHDPPQAGAARESRSPNARGPMPPFCLNSEELMRDVAGRDRSLARVLGPALGQKTVAEVMEDLFSAGDSSVWKERACAPQAGDEELPERQPAQPLPPSCGGALGALPGSAYYNMSVGKAKLPGKVKDPPAVNSEEEEEEMDRDLAQKKVQLIESISRKLVVLQEAQRGLEDDLNANVALGKEVESHVKRVCKAHEFEKFRLFIGDLDKVVNLLLSLSGRLARVENALGSLAPDAPEEEKLALLEKKRQLTAQLEDARELQEHVARRERAVFASVSRCLPSEQLQDYQHFVRMKSALAIQQRQLDDKIKLGEEQLRSLRESLRRTGAREY